MIHARLSLVVAIVLVLMPLHGPDGAAVIDDLPDFAVQLPAGGHEDDNLAQAGMSEPDNGNGNDADAEATPAAADDDHLPADDSGSGGDMPSRLLKLDPGPLTLWIILPGKAFTVPADDTCLGAGSYIGVQPGGVVSLLDEGAGATHVESVMIEAAGTVYFDTVLQEDVCAFDLAFTRVVPGTSVLIDLDRVVLGRFDHVAPAPASGEPPVYDIVAGA